jgi:glycosyltransferase involved in cell wall biosynthesis
MYEIAIVVPAHNEVGTIGRVIEAFHKELPHVKFIIIDNSSTDSTQSEARAALRRLGCDGAILFEPRLGKGNAVRCALREVHAQAYVFVDADMTYPAKQVHELLRPVLTGEADMVVGERFTRAQYSSSTNRPLHRLGNLLVNGLVNWLFRGSFVDVMSGYRVLSERFVRTCPILAEGFEIETEMALHSLDKRIRVVEIPVDYFARPRGSKSKVRTFRDGVQVLFGIARGLRQYRPLFFFSLTSLSAGLLALLAASAVLNHWFRQQGSHVLLTLLASTLAAISLGVMCVGIVLDWMAYRDKQAFERDFRQAQVPDATTESPTQSVRAKSNGTFARAV